MLIDKIKILMLPLFSLYILGCDDSVEKVMNIKIDQSYSYGNITNDQINKLISDESISVIAQYEPKTKIPFINSSLGFCSDKSWIKISPDHPCLIPDVKKEKITPIFKDRTILLNVPLKKGALPLYQVLFTINGKNIKNGFEGNNLEVVYYIRPDSNKENIIKAFSIGNSYRGTQGSISSNIPIGELYPPTQGYDNYQEINNQLVYYPGNTYSGYMNIYNNDWLGKYANTNKLKELTLKNLPISAKGKYKDLNNAYFKSQIVDSKVIEKIVIDARCSSPQKSAYCDFGYFILYVDNKLVFYQHKDWVYDNNKTTSKIESINFSDDGEVNSYHYYGYIFDDDYNREDYSHSWAYYCNLSSKNIVNRSSSYSKCDIEKPSNIKISELKNKADQIKSWFN